MFFSFSMPAKNSRNYLERVRLVKGAVLKTVGCKSLGGSIPFFSVDMLQAYQALVRLKVGKVNGEWDTLSPLWMYSCYLTGL